MKCLYCSKADDEMWVVSKATKPKAHPYRWQTLGYCCDPCHAAGKPVIHEFDPSQVTVTPPKQEPQ